jgi:hypothetical protein
MDEARWGSLTATTCGDGLPARPGQGAEALACGAPVRRLEPPPRVTSADRRCARRQPGLSHVLVFTTRTSRGQRWGRPTPPAPLGPVPHHSRAPGAPAPSTPRRPAPPRRCQSQATRRVQVVLVVQRAGSEVQRAVLGVRILDQPVAVVVDRMAVSSAPCSPGGWLRRRASEQQATQRRRESNPPPTSPVQEVCRTLSIKSVRYDSPGRRRAHLLSAEVTRGGGSRHLSETIDASASAPCPGRRGRPASQVVAVSEPHLASSIPVDTSDSPTTPGATTITPAQWEPVWTRRGGVNKAKTELAITVLSHDDLGRTAAESARSSMCHRPTTGPIANRRMASGVSKGTVPPA